MQALTYLDEVQLCAVIQRTELISPCAHAPQSRGGLKPNGRSQMNLTCVEIWLEAPISQHFSFTVMKT